MNDVSRSSQTSQEVNNEKQLGHSAENDVLALITKWSGCWCGPQLANDHDPRVRDCPQHGSDDCRHMAEGIVIDLRDISGARVATACERCLRLGCQGECTRVTPPGGDL